MSHQQVRRRVPRQALLRRLRSRRPGGAARHRPRQADLPGGARQRAAALRGAGQLLHLHGADAAGRDLAGDVAAAWRSPVARHVGEPHRAGVEGPFVRRARRHRADRLQHGARPGQDGAAAGDRGRRLGLRPDHRLRGVPIDRRRSRGVARGRHGALRRAGGGRRLSVAGAARARHHQHHPQDAARTARRVHPLSRRARQGDRQVGLPRRPGRAARTRHRRQGGGVRRGAHPRFQALRRAGGGERPGAGRGADGARVRDRLRRHRFAPDAGRPPAPAN